MMRLFVAFALTSCALIIWMISMRMRRRNAQERSEKEQAALQMRRAAESSARQAAQRQIQAQYDTAHDALRDELFPNAMTRYHEAHAKMDKRYRADVKQHEEDYPVSELGASENYAEWSARNSSFEYPPPGPDQGKYQVPLTDYYDADAVEAELQRRRESGELDLPDLP